MIRRFLDALRLEVLLGSKLGPAVRIAWAYAIHGDPPVCPCEVPGVVSGEHLAECWFEEPGPYVCPDCHSVAPERCARGCPEDARYREWQEGDVWYERDATEDDDDESEAERLATWDRVLGE